MQEEIALRPLAGNLCDGRGTFPSPYPEAAPQQGKETNMIQEEKRKVLGRLVYGVCVVGTRVGEDDVHGFTAAWVSQVSIDPPLVMVAVSKTGKANERIRQAGGFSLSLLSQGQEHLARQFAGDPSVGEDLRTTAADYFRTRGVGQPVLKKCKAWLDCALVETASVGGDHDLFIGSVSEAGEPGEGEPMVLHQTDLPYYGI